MAIDGLEGSTIALKWVTAPASQLTVEYWVNVLDSHLSQQPVFHYSVYSVTGRYNQGGSPYENANECSLLHAPDYARFWRSTSSVDMDMPQPYANAGSWLHVAVVWSADPSLGPNGQLSFYINGQRIANKTECALSACDMGMPIQPGGIVHIGQEADRAYGDFDELQSFTGVVDEMRVWTAVRTDAQILASFEGGVSNVTDDDLSFYWRFDEPGLTRGDVTIDVSGHGRDGLIGRMPTIRNQLQYATQRPSQEPKAPIQLPSTADLVVTGSNLVVPIVDGANAFALRAADPDGDTLNLTITSLPLHGTLTAAAGGAALSVGDIFSLSSTTGTTLYSYQLVYTPQSFGSWVSDSFNYSVSDGGSPVFATVELVRYAMPQPMAKQYSFGEDELPYMVLGKPGVSSVQKRTVNFQVVITRLPNRGQLFQACFRPGGDGTYTAICKPGGPGALIPIDAPNTIVNSSRGIVMFAPHKDEFQEGYTSFGYRFVDPDNAALESAEAFVNISITPTNDAPIAAGATAQPTNLSVPVIFTLAAVDKDENASSPRTYDRSFAPHSFAKIMTFPRGGRLYQATAGGGLGESLDATVTSVPTVSSWVSEVVRYSSQYSKCQNCFVWSGAENTGCNQANPASSSTCSPEGACAVAYGEPLAWGSSTCTEIAWQANQILGPPDFYPGYADTPLGWDLSAENSGREWIELRFAAPVYVSGFELYETFKPGAVYRLSSAITYDDDNTVACCGADAAAARSACASLPVCSTATSWNAIWTGVAGNSGEKANIFSPPVCPYAYKTDILRVDLDTAAASGWNNYDAARLIGTTAFPPGLILPDQSAPSGKENKVAYLPLPGVHGTDSFTYAVTDCLAYGQPATIEVTLPAPASAFAAPPFLHFAVVLQETSAGIPPVSAALAEAQHSGTFSLYELLDGGAPVRVELVGMRGSLSTIVLPTSATPSTLSMSGLRNTTLLESDWTATQQWLATGGTGEAELWFSNGGALTYRVLVTVQPPFAQQCAPGTIVSIDASGAKCVPCPPGTFEVKRALCEEADSRHFIPLKGQTVEGKVACPANMRHSNILFEGEEISVQLATGAKSITECSCAPGFYVPRSSNTSSMNASLLSSDTTASTIMVRKYAFDVLEGLSAYVADMNTACLPCPIGGICLGNRLPAIAAPGYGVLSEEENSVFAFYPCNLGCAQPDLCDCKGGRHLSDNRWLPMECGYGYQAGSALCSLCDKDGTNTAKLQGMCLRCDWPTPLYSIITLVVVLVWFPLNAYLCEAMESLEISFAFLQFLGTYSTFAITWPSPLDAIFGILAFFALDIEVMHFACDLPQDTWGWQYLVVWSVYAFLPIIYVIYCTICFFVDWVLYKLVSCGWLHTLLARGWRPRRDFSLASARDTYMPRFIMYTHIYYLSGVGKALDPLFCEPIFDAFGEPTGASYLRKNPAMQCYEGAHAVMLGLDSIALLFYAVLCPAAYFYVFFRLVPKHGLSSQRLNHLYGFLWSRFEEHAYWWESVELVRKFGLVLCVALLGNQAMPQSVLTAVLVLIVFIVSLVKQPFIRGIYDLYDNLATGTLILIILLGVILEGNAASSAAGDMEADVEAWYVGLCMFLAITAFGITVAFGAVAIFQDWRRLLMVYRMERLRTAKGLTIPERCFRLSINSTQEPNPAILKYLAGIEEPQKLAEIRKVERMMKNSLAFAQENIVRKTRSAFMDRQLKAEPKLLDWLLLNGDANNDLTMFMTHALRTREEFGKDTAAEVAIAKETNNEIALWLSEGASDEDRLLFRTIVQEIGRFTKRAGKEWDPIEALKGLAARIRSGARVQANRLSKSTDGVEAEASSPGRKPKGPSAWAAKGSLLSSLSKKKDRLELMNKIEKVLDVLIEDTLSEAIVLMPNNASGAGAAADDTSMPRLVVVRADEMSENAAEAARLDVMRTTAWDMPSDTPSGVCKATGQPVLVRNLLLDTRFRRVFLKEPKSALSAISQLCVPVYSRTGELLAIVKCLNKMTPAGDRSGLPYDPSDEDHAVAAAAELAMALHEHTESLTTTKQSIITKALTGKRKIGGGLLQAAAAHRDAAGTKDDPVEATPVVELEPQTDDAVEELP